MEIAKLTKQTTRIWIQELLHIEDRVQAKHNGAFSDEHWKADNFLIDIKGKWDYSQVTLIAHTPVGYCICTAVDKDNYYINRIAILPEMQRQGAGSSMINRILEMGSGKRLLAETNLINIPARIFYERLDFRRLSTIEIKEYLRLRSKSGFISRNDCFQEEGSKIFKVVYIRGARQEDRQSFSQRCR